MAGGGARLRGVARSGRGGDVISLQNLEKNEHVLLHIGTTTTMKMCASYTPGRASSMAKHWIHDNITITSVVVELGYNTFTSIVLKFRLYSVRRNTFGKRHKWW
eukprot:299683-Amphidinium_carterae.1